MWAQSFEMIPKCRDHPSHGADVPAGMWGARLEDSDFRDILFRGMEEILREAIFNKFRSQLNNYNYTSFLKAVESQWWKGLDQYLLSKWLWPYINSFAVVHDSYHCLNLRSGHWRPFPSK